MMDFTTIKGFAKVAIGTTGISGFRTIIEKAEAEVAYLADLIEPGDYAVERLDTAPPGRGVNQMISGMPIRQKFRVLPVMFNTIGIVATCGKYMMDKLNPTRESADANVWDAVRELVKSHGAVEVGFAKINEHDIFQDFAIPYQNAVVFTIDMKREAIDTAPSYDALIEVISTYGLLGNLALKLSDYLREQGYGAYPGFPIGGLVDYVRVGQDAGMGAIGYHGMLISPTEGTRQRIGIVFTNMAIPDPEPNPHEWLLDFCAKCQKCVRECPPNAIYTDAESHPETGRKPTIDYNTCVDYYGENQGCAVCVKVCPFSQAGYEKIQDAYLNAQARRLAREAVT